MKCQRFFTYCQIQEALPFLLVSINLKKVRYYLLECFGLHNLHTTANILPETLFVSSSGSVKQIFANDLMNERFLGHNNVILN